VDSVGTILRGWREQRRLSQLQLAVQADVSTRHLSFVETGRSRPSRDLLLHLADELDVPLRDRNRMLLAAGYAPAYSEAPIDSPALEGVRDALRQLLAGHEPYPAVVVDAAWRLVDGNSGIALLTAGVAPELLEPPANVLRISLHPDGMAPRIVNLAEWRGHLLARLRRQLAVSADQELSQLYDELAAYPGGESTVDPRAGGVVAPMRIRQDGGELSFFGMVATFGTPLDVTVSELAIEAFYPADPATAAYLHQARHSAPTAAAAPPAGRG